MQFSLSPFGWCVAVVHITFFGVYAPYRALRAIRRWWRRSEPILPFSPSAIHDRARYFDRKSIGIAWKGLFSLATALVLQLQAFPPHMPGLRSFLLALIVGGVISVVDLRHARRSLSRGDASIVCQLPTNRRERRSWIILSVTAGVTEELTWRGVQVSLLTALVGSAWLAAFISAVTFGIGHVVPGPKWALKVVGFALLLQLLVWTEGALYLAMAVHAAVNLISGLYTSHAASTIGYKDPREDWRGTSGTRNLTKNTAIFN